MKRMVMLLGVFLTLGCGVSRGGIIISNAWESGGLEGWTNKAFSGGVAFGDVSYQAALAGHTALQITNAAGAGVEEDFIYDTDDLAGNKNYTDWGGSGTNVESITFEFYANTGGALEYPAGLSLYFLSGQGANDYLWYYTFTAASISAGWATLSADMTAGASGWWSPTRADGDFTTDLADVDEIGILLEYQPDYSDQVYGIDYFRLNDAPIAVIPEPGTYVILAFALVSLSATLRRNRRRSCSDILKG